MKRIILLKLPVVRMLVVLVLAAVFMPACERNALPGESSSDSAAFSSPSSSIKEKYNKDMDHFARAESRAVRSNSSFRKIIKDEAMLMIDGDYDVLIRRILDRKVIPHETSLKSSVEYTVKDLLEDSFPEEAKRSKKSDVSLVESLSGEYPGLQVAIPVHAEDWDESAYIPEVTFIPADYDESTTTEVTAYDPDGNPVLLDAVNEPADPVLVIGENERIYPVLEEGEVLPPPAPVNLAGRQTESGIFLMWEMPEGTDPAGVTGFYIYRKNSTQESYVLAKTIPGAYNISYNDNFVTAGCSYSYYVTAYFQAVSSEPSNSIVVVAPLFPKPVLAFDAIQNSASEVELRWQNDHSQYIQETRIYKHIVGVTTSYQLMKTFGPGDQDYFDNDVRTGTRMIYKINHVTSIGESNAKYDFVHVPYRDPSKTSAVYIKKIRFTDWDIEGWLAGKPEFYITVSNVDPGSKTPFTVQDQVTCDFSSRSSTSQTFYNKKILDWQPGFWYDMLTFYALEYDRSLGTLKINVSPGYNQKNLLKTGLEARGTVSYEITFSDKGEKCGSSYLNYFDTPEQWISFPNYGASILISETDN